MSNNILCHIVGLNKSTKDNFINNLLSKYKQIIIIDLDDISYKISNKHVMDNLFTKYNIYKNNNNKKSIQIENKMGKFWKIIMTQEINKLLNKNKNKKIILLGLTVFQKNHNYRIDVDNITKKYIYKTNIKQNAQNIIRQNLKMYEKNIISGSFPLQLIDLNYLIKKREEIINYYKKKKYELKNLSVIINYIRKHMDQYESISLISKIYVGLKEKYDNVINLNKIIGYTEDWLAIVSIIPNVNNKIKKGFINNKPFIEEKYKNSMNSFNTNGYLYEVDKTNFSYLTKNGKFKLIATKPVKIIKRIYISNIYKKLSKKNIKFDFIF